jgi:acetyl esterase/lipase
MTNRTRRTSTRFVFALAIFLLLLYPAKRVIVHLAWKGIADPPVERLWSGEVPGALGTTDADQPSVAVFLPARWHSTKAGMVVVPGGGYKMVMSSYEGEDVARWLNSFGVAAFVLTYRIAPRYHHPAALVDATRAVRYVRYHAARFGVLPERVGIIGFSAGGHLASTVMTHFDSGDPQAADPVDRISSRPDFAVLGYPLISLESPWAHAGSVSNLLGPNPDPAQIRELSNDLQVTEKTPPAFLFHTTDDIQVPAQNSILFYSALHSHGVDSELHIFEHGGHGAGLANGHGAAPRVPDLVNWSALAEDWIVGRFKNARTWSYSMLFRL